MLIVQIIKTEWTKLSRGAPNATKRNAVPEVFPVIVSDSSFLDAPVLVHTLHFYEWANFVNPREQLEIFETKKEIQLDSVILTQAGEQIKINYYNCTPKLFVLNKNEWGKMLYNKRYIGDYDGNWYYEKGVVNIGNFTHFNSNAFLSYMPLYTYNTMKHLI